MNKRLRAVRTFFDSTTTRLSLTYLAIIMIMSIGFSVVFYNTSSHELGRQLPPPNHRYVNDFQPQPADSTANGQAASLSTFLQDRIDEGRHNLLLELMAVNIGALVLGSLISYQLARRTLEPIEAAVEAQTQFVSDASHELRTPLTAIQASNEVALRKPGLTLTQAKQVIRNNSEDTQRLQELSEGLLRLARQENQALALEPIALQVVASDAMTHVVTLASQKHIAVEDRFPDFSVLADRAGLTKVLIILLDNAIKYSPAHSTIYLEARRRGKYGYLTVRDQGSGIPADELAHIFQRFYRVDAARSSGQHAGYGLGLSIARQLVDQQHGELSVRSELNKGSSFTIRLSLTPLKV